MMSMLMSDLVDIEKNPTTSYTALVRFEHFSKLTDDLIGRILFSGYLPRVWNEIVPLLLINKHFMALGRKYIAFIDFKSKQWHEVSGGTITDNVLNTSRLAQNLVFMDLCYTNVNLNLPVVREAFLQWSSSLRGLNLRGTSVNDTFCEVIGQLHQLVYLDVSKISHSSAGEISDDGGLYLSRLTKLKWFCAGSTSITDITIKLLLENCKELNHLVLSLCAGITNDGLSIIKEMSLKTLDISSCLLINTTGLHDFLSSSSPLSKTLEIFNCSFLSSPRTPLLNLLCDKFMNLRLLEMRRRNPEHLDEELLTRVMKRFDVIILNHEDQLRIPHILNIVPFSPSVNQICTIFTWPYMKNTDY